MSSGSGSAKAETAPPRDGGWEHFPHEADVGIRGFGPTKEAAFEQAACALTAVQTDLVRVQPRDAVPIACEAPDDELLLVDWLNALVFEAATRRMMFGRFSVRIKDGRLRGEAWGEAIDVPRHAPAAEVKGATYTALEVARKPDGRWVAQCVVDV
ncbi:MAG: archease [Kiloniellaceae bacterium]